MPIYEYACDNCGEIVEEFQSISDKPLKKCKLCGSKKVHKLVSSTSFILKGSGWYVTDYARKSNKSGEGKKSGEKTGEKKKDSGSSTGSSSSGTSESKSAKDSHTHP